MCAAELYAPEQFPETSITLLDKPMVQGLQVQALCFSSICEKWSKFFRGSQYFAAKKFRGVRIYQKKIVPRGTNLGEVHFLAHLSSRTHFRASKISKFPGGMPPPPHSPPTYSRPTFCVCPGLLQSFRWPGGGSSN